MYSKYELIHAYAPYILTTVKERAERYEKDIYHELRELNQLSKTKITKNNTTWKQELRDMLSLEGYQLEYEDLTPDVESSLINTLAESGYSTEIVKDLGVQSLIQTIQKGHFKNSPKKQLKPEQIRGLQRELIVTIKRFAWAKDLDDRALVINTEDFDKGAYSEGKFDITVRLPKVQNRRQVRSEVKAYTEIFKIGTLGSKYLQPILDSMWFSVNQQTKEIVFHLDDSIIEEQCDNFLMDKYDNFFPFIEDGKNILLFSDFIDNVTGSNATKRVELRNYDAPIMTSQSLDGSTQVEILQKTALRGEERKKIAHSLGLSSNNYSLWYGKR
jgi:hypothetical protein